jgi:hypothetical protein
MSWPDVAEFRLGFGISTMTLLSALQGSVDELWSLPLMLSLLGSATNLLSLKLLADGRRAGWAVGLAALGPSVALALVTGAYANAAACVVYAALYVRAFNQGQ